MIWLCALMLTVLTVLTTPFAVSKYTTRGTGAAKARIAAWEVVFADRPRISNNGAAITYRDLASGRTAWWQELSFRNDSEVMVNFTFWVGYVEDNALTPDEYSPKVPSSMIEFTQFNAAAPAINPVPVHNANETWTIQNIPPATTAWVQVHFFSNSFDGYGALGARTSYKCKLFFEAVQVD